MTYYSGDTVTIQATFTAAVAEGQPLGAALDPDGSVVTVTIYNTDHIAIQTGTASKQSTGVYNYDWTMPTEPGSYVVEFKGFIATKPQLKRSVYKVAFK